jgi:hypothetical protein
MATEVVEAVEAKHGERMIEVRVRFWTNDLADRKGKIRPKHAWAGGEVVMKANDAHGIRPQESAIFNSMAELPAVIEKVLKQHGVTQHSDRKPLATE